MLYSKGKKSFWILISVLLGGLFFIGGLGIGVEVVQYFGVLLGVLLIILSWLLKRKIQLPRGINLYSLFLIIFLINSFFISVDTKKSLEIFSLFLGGGLFWVAAYNLRKELSSSFDKLIIILGLIFAGLFILNNLVGDPELVRTWSLINHYSSYKNHYNLGDFWSVALTVLIVYILKRPKSLKLWALAVFGSYLLFISQSRAAYVALAAGVFYIAQNKGWNEKYRKILAVFVIIAISFFLITGIQKSILTIRPYYVQGIIGFFSNPQGVGVGNFGEISRNPENHVLGLSGFSSAAHNIVLEILTGLGILGVIFVIWLTKILIRIWEDKNNKTLVYRAAFLALTVNFFFFTSYFIPMMLWLWFIVLGLAQKRPEEINYYSRLVSKK